ncbi:hypothetical protein BaRGS_00007447 [Batillaria attramentaria]|uniref:Secreted protein n=1 Tax=Batillaria attramentaria TaxID=370345 RepID=A0ABD0LPQ9_9CAEN
MRLRGIAWPRSLSAAGAVGWESCPQLIGFEFRSRMVSPKRAKSWTVLITSEEHEIKMVANANAADLRW